MKGPYVSLATNGFTTRFLTISHRSAVIFILMYFTSFLSPPPLFSWLGEGGGYAVICISLWGVYFISHSNKTHTLDISGTKRLWHTCHTTNNCSIKDAENEKGYTWRMASISVKAVLGVMRLSVLAIVYSCALYMFNLFSFLMLKSPKWTSNFYVFHCGAWHVIYSEIL